MEFFVKSPTLLVQAVLPSMRVPMQRLGTPQDVAAMVAFLASEAASFVTGQRITVNGGHVL